MSACLRIAVVGSLLGAALTPWGLAAPASAAVAVAYVDEDGADTGNCASTATACETVSYALAQVDGEATVKVSGTIHDNVQVPGELPSITITGAYAPAGSPAVLQAAADGTVITTQSALTVDHLTVRGGNGGSGGGIHASSAALTISHSTITGNEAQSGGGVYAWQGESLLITDSTISDNTASGAGGGVWAGGAAVTIARSTLSGNAVASGDGGAVYQYGAADALNIGDSTISGNSASSKGGGISSVNLAMANSTITGNSALWGSAVENRTGTMLVRGSTVVGNSTRAIHTSSGKIRLAGTIIGANGAVSCYDSMIVSLGYNTDAGTGCELDHATDLVGTDPALGSLLDNGGPTSTHRPATGSPVVDRIPAGATADDHPLCERLDQRGVAGPVAGATGCAIGAVEPADWVAVEQTPLLVTSTSGSAGTPLTLVTSGGSGSGTVTFVAGDGTASGCTVGGSPAQLSADSAGTCLVTAAKAAHATYLATSSAPTPVSLAAVDQEPLVLVAGSGVAGATVALDTSGGSGSGAVGYEIVGGTASGCALLTSPTRVSATTVGTCQVRATKGAAGIYLPATSETVPVTFGPAEQAPLRVHAADGSVGTPVELSTTGGSGSGAVSFAVVGGSAAGCTVVADRLSATGAGGCVVTATKAADAVHRAVTSAGTSVSFSARAVITSAPGPVRSLKVGGKARSAKRVATWRAPALDGGAAVTAYRVLVTKGGRTLLSTSVRSTRLVLRASRLRQGRLRITVRAVNRVGAGTPARAAFTVR
ncbi:right-handed parallel beta-helix repeat-containing protein [Nocardioides sp. W7]|uniref:right-handed parallel beta-helix repeat-containing protein n=1 Tax=Nocardioides sp. W7 TaxID=2931390 RepID=UPI001FD49001|nr:right-handed parallel beta-helix repeat-containing protein [Nocardioides sp. W7]